MRFLAPSLSLLASVVFLTGWAQEPVAPKLVDLRPTLDQFGLKPRQQGGRPTCSVFTVVSAVEFAVAQRQGQTPRLSVEFLNWAGNKVCGDGQDGGFFSDLWKGFAEYGICTEADMPYESALERARLPSAGAMADAKTRLGFGLRLHWIKEWNVNTGLTSQEFNGIKGTLENGWPVCGGLRWPKQEKWVDNVLQMCPPDAVRDGHSVLLVGYRDDAAQPGGGVFIFRNTAGSGKDGTMPYGYAQQYLNDAAWVDFEKRSKPGKSTALAPMDPLSRLTTLPGGQDRRMSSNELPKWNDSNLDMTIRPREDK